MADYRKSSVHCHSTLCDGKNTLQEMAGAACAQGLTTLGFSGHSYTKPDREYCMTPGRTALYRATIAKLKNEYRGKVDILCGIEWDLLSEGTPKGFDYWIGSVHHLYGKNTGKYYEIDFRPEDLRDCINNDFDGDPLAAVEAYFAEVEKIAAKKPDILGHIDLVKKLNADGSFFDEESPRYKAAAFKALQAARENDCILEVNTGGVYRGYRKDFYPGAWLLGEWNKLGRNRERRERDHENLRGDVPLEFQAVPDPKIAPLWMNLPRFRQLCQGNFLDIIFSCPYELHELTTNRFLSKLFFTLSDEQKEVLYYLFVKQYSTTRLAAIRGQSDRNIRKLRMTIQKKLQKRMYEHLSEKLENDHGLTLREREFMEEYEALLQTMGKDAVIRRENKTKPRKKKAVLDDAKDG